MTTPAPRADEGAEPTELPHWERCIWCGAAPPFLGTCPKVPDGGRCGSLRVAAREHHNWCRLGMMPPAPLDTLCTCGQRPPDVRRGSSLHAAHCPRSHPDPGLPLSVACECSRPASSGDGGAPKDCPDCGRNWADPAIETYSEAHRGGGYHRRCECGAEWDDSRFSYPGATPEQGEGPGNG